MAPDVAGARGAAGRLRMAALGAAAGFALVVPAGAAEPPPTRPGRYHLGPLYLSPRLEIRDAGVDTNVFNTGAQPVPDTAMVVRPILGIALPIGGRARIDAEGALGLNYFHRLSSERSTGASGTLSGELQLGPVVLGAGGGLESGKERFSIAFDERVQREQEWATGRARFDLTRRASVTFFVTRRQWRFGRLAGGGVDVQSSLDRDEALATAEARFALTRRTTLVAGADTTDYTFAFPAAGGRLVRAQRYLGGFEFSRRAVLSGRVLAGYRVIPGGAAPAYRGPAVLVSASAPLARFGRLTIKADRDVYYGLHRFRAPGERLRNTYVSNMTEGALTIGLPLDLVGGGIVRRETARYLLPGLLEGGLGRRVDRQWTVQGRLLRRLGDHASVGGAITLIRRASSFPGLSYHGLRYGLQAEVAP